MTAAKNYHITIPEKYQNIESLQCIRDIIADSPYTIAFIQEQSMIAKIYTCAQSGDLERVTKRQFPHNNPIELRLIGIEGQEDAKKLWERVLNALQE